MSGRTLGVQASWDDVLRKLDPDIDRSELNKAIGIADSMNQQIEEFLNRYAVTALNDNGDITFDAAGTYTFEGNIVVNGTSDLNGAVTLDGDMTATGDIVLSSSSVFGTSASGQRLEIGSGTFEYDSIAMSGIELYSGNANETRPGFIGVSSADSQIKIEAPTNTDLVTTSDAPAVIELTQSSGVPQIYFAARRFEFQALDPTNPVMDLNNVVSMTGVREIVFGSGDDGLAVVTGTYGSVQTVGSGVGSREGYNIDGHASFVSAGSTSSVFIHDDTNGNNMFKGVREGEVSLFYDGEEVVRTLGSGLEISSDGFTTTRYQLSNNIAGLAGDGNRGMSVLTSQAAEIYRTTTSAANIILALYSDNGGGGTDQQWVVYADGDTASDTGVYTTISDVRVKDQITPIDPATAMAALRLVNPVTGVKVAKAHPETGKITPRAVPVPFSGYIAQNVGEHIPSAWREKNGLQFVSKSELIEYIHSGLLDVDQRLAAAGL